MEDKTAKWHMPKHYIQRSTCGGPKEGLEKQKSIWGDPDLGPIMF